MSNDISPDNRPLGLAPVRRPAATRPAITLPVEPPATDGNPVPPGGNEKPVQKSRVPAVDIERAIANLNEYMQDSGRDIRFHVDEGSGRTVITVLNTATDEVIRQIPPDEMLAIARRVRDLDVQLISKTV